MTNTQLKLVQEHNPVKGNPTSGLYYRWIKQFFKSNQMLDAALFAAWDDQYNRYSKIMKAK